MTLTVGLLSRRSNGAALRGGSRASWRRTVAFLPSSIGLVVIVTLGLCARILLAGQYQVADLSPVGSTRDMFALCLLPYQDAGLGRANSASVPGLCVSGVLAALFGAANAQHFFLVGTLAGAGLSMLWLLRRLGNPPILSLTGALLYELSPAIVNQFGQGGPGLLLTGAVLPAVAAVMVAPPEANPYVEGARAAGILGLATLFNPQVPFLAAVLLIPFVPLVIGNGRGYFVRASLTAGFVYGLATFPVLLTLGSQVEVIHTHINELSAELSRGIAAISPAEFVIPYAWVGLAPAMVGAIITAIGRKAHPGEVAALGSTLLILSLFLVFHMEPTIVLRWASPLLLFKDFIKFQILLGIPVVIFTIAATRWAVQRYGEPRLRRQRVVVVFLTLAIASGPIWGLETRVIASGDMGLGSGALPNVVVEGINMIKTVGNRSGAFRVLWLPQDLRTVGTVGSLLPSALFYRDDAPVPARRLVLQIFDAFVRGDTNVVAPVLAEAGVRYVVLQQDYRVQPDAPFEAGYPTIAAIGGTKVLAGAPGRFEQLLAASPGMRRLAVQRGIVIYANILWRPLIEVHRGLMAVDKGARPPSSVTGPPLPLRWQSASASGNVAQNWTLREVRIPASLQRSWSPAYADVPVIGGNDYLVSGRVEAWHAVETHVKVIWMGDREPQISLVKRLQSRVASASFQVIVHAPEWASGAQLFLMGGWADGHEGYSTFRDIGMQPLLRAPVLRGLGERFTAISTLRRQFPDLLIEPSPVPEQLRSRGVAVATLGERECKPTEQTCARLLAPSDVKMVGIWGVAAGGENDALLGWFTAANRDSEIVIPARILRTMPRGSFVSWLEFQEADVGRFDPLVHREVIPPNEGELRLHCRTAKCAIGNVILFPVVRRGVPVSRVLRAPVATPRGVHGAVGPISIENDWGSVYAGVVRTIDWSVDDPRVRARLTGVMISSLALVVALGVVPFIACREGRI